MIESHSIYLNQNVVLNLKNKRDSKKTWELLGETLWTVAWSRPLSPSLELRSALLLLYSAHRFFLLSQLSLMVHMTTHWCFCLYEGPISEDKCLYIQVYISGIRN